MEPKVVQQMYQRMKAAAAAFGAADIKSRYGEPSADVGTEPEEGDSISMVGEEPSEESPMPCPKCGGKGCPECAEEV